MGAAEIIIPVDAALGGLPQKAFVGGVLLLCIILLITKLLHPTEFSRRVTLVLILGVIVLVSGILLGSAWVSITDTNQVPLGVYR